MALNLASHTRFSSENRGLVKLAGIGEKFHSSSTHHHPLILSGTVNAQDIEALDTFYELFVDSRCRDYFHEYFVLDQEVNLQTSTGRKI